MQASQGVGKEMSEQETKTYVVFRWVDPPVENVTMYAIEDEEKMNALAEVLISSCLSKRISGFSVSIEELPQS